MGLLLAMDQLSKVWVRVSVPMHQGTNLIPNLIDLTHVENKGVSFSFLGNIDDGVRVPLLVGISLIAVAMLGYYWFRHHRQMNLWSNTAFVFIIPGAVGNLIDRSLYGAVTDFFHFRFYDISFFVNNIADIQISLGVMAFVVGTFLSERSPTR